MCLCVRLWVRGVSVYFVRSHNSKAARLNFTNFLDVLPVAVAQSSSDGVYDVLYTSGFMADVIFSYHGTNGTESLTT